MDVSHFRQENFARLFREFREAHSHLPDRGMFKLFAEKVEVSDRYLSHVRNGRRELGNATVRQIEARLGKPHGWMDLPHTDDEPRDADERTLVEQIINLYRHSPDVVKRLIAEAIKEVLNAKADLKHDKPSETPVAKRAKRRA